MKILYGLLLILVAGGCPQEDIALASVSYEAVSRGFYYKSQLVEDEILVQRGRKTDKEKYSCKASHWKQLKKLVTEIDPELITELEAPSTKSHYDGAAIASITVEVNGKTYQSNSFDHGNPPEVLKPLVDYVLKLSETVDSP